MAAAYNIPITERDACAYGRSLPISTKTSVELCKALKNKTYAAAKEYLLLIMEEKAVVPFMRYKHNIGHRKGPFAAGRYPYNVSKFVLQILESAASNATNKGFASGDLIIKHISAHQGPKTMHSGRHRGKAKKTHVQVILTEKKMTNEKKQQKKAVLKNKETKKNEEKKVVS